MQVVGSGNTDSDVRVARQMSQRLVSVLLPGTSIPCIVDEISEFDTELWERSRYLKMVVGYLRVSVMSSGTSDKHNAYLKDLMTCSNSSSKAMRIVLIGDQQITLAAGNFISQPMLPISPALLTEELQKSRPRSDTLGQESQSKRRHSTTNVMD